MASKGKYENRAKWNEIHKAHLVKLLVKYNVPAYRSQNGWTKEAWNKILHGMMNKFSNASYTINQVKALEQELKKTYKILKSLAELSGFGWDYERHVVSAPDDVWVPLLERNKEVRRWYKKPFPYFVALREIHEGRYAEGKRSRGIEDYEVTSESPVQTPGPSVLTPNDDPIQSSPTHEREDDYYIQVKPLCTQPPISQPQSSSSEMHRGLGDQDKPRRKREQKRENPQDSFMDRYIAFRERENDRFLDTMKMNQVEEKYTIGECIEVFNTVSALFTKEDMFKATQVFMKDKSYREVFLCLKEDDRVPWLQMMCSRME